MSARPKSVLAIIPARGGSERLPGKNLLPVAGLPLVAHSIGHARRALMVTETIVSTEDTAIAAVARAHGAEVVERPAELAGPTATTESAMLHVLDHRRGLGHQDPDLVVLLQATSPVRHEGEVDAAIESLLAAGADSLFSATRNHTFVWATRPEGMTSLTYDHRRRPREQDLEPQWAENGSIYVLRPSVLREHDNRLGGRIGVHVMDHWSSFQLDRPEEASLLEWILSQPAYRPPVPWPEQVELVVWDFDGVMTDNRLVLDEQGRESVFLNRSDGWGIGTLRAAGVAMMVLSTEPNPVVARRAEKMRIECHQDVADKAAYLAALLAERGIDPAHVAFVGNDANDVECMRLVGFPVVPADAEAVAMAEARLVLGRRGGHGAVREFCDRLLRHLGREDARPR